MLAFVRYDISKKNFFKLLQLHIVCDIIIRQSKIAYALLAQLDRVFGYEPKGQGFESLTARQNKNPFSNIGTDFLF